MAANETTTSKTTPAKKGKVVIDGVEYTQDQLSEEVRNQLGNLRAVDMEINHLQQQLAIIRTARSVYAAALKRALPAQPAEKETGKK